MPHAVLVVEDQADLAALIKLHLADIDCEAEIAADGAAALRMASQSDFDLVVLDVGLPDLDGFEICRRLRAAHPRTRVLMLTARAAENDRVAGLDSGADDYVAKPFSMRELLARVRAQARRFSEPAVPLLSESLRIGDLTVDAKRRCARLGRREVELTATEFALLACLAREPGRVWTRAQLLQEVWGYNHDGYEHTVNTHINRLRAKIEADPTRPTYIRTVWGTGYRFVEPHELA